MLCSLLIPGVLNKLMKQNASSRSLNSDELNRVAAFRAVARVPDVPLGLRAEGCPEHRVECPAFDAGLLRGGRGQSARTGRGRTSYLFGHFPEVTRRSVGCPDLVGRSCTRPRRIGPVSDVGEVETDWSPTMTSSCCWRSPRPPTTRRRDGRVCRDSCRCTRPRRLVSGWVCQPGRSAGRRPGACRCCRTPDTRQRFWASCGRVSLPCP